MGDCPFQPGAQVCAYLRDSGGQRQELSTAQQEAVIRGWCADNQLTLVRVFSDVARSGGSMAGRDQLDVLLRYVASGPKIAGVVFWSYSRLARNYDDAQYIRSTIRRAGYTVHSLEESIPPGDIGRVVESLHDFAAAQYRKDLSQAVKRGYGYIVRTFKVYPRAVPPRGYLKVPVVIGTRRDGTPHLSYRLEIDPELGPKVTQAFELRAAGYTWRQVHERTGLYGSISGYRDFSGNQIYLGRFVWAGEAIEDFCPPLTTPATFSAVRAMVNDRYTHYRKSRSGHYLLSGILTCARCGGVMSGNRVTVDGRRYDTYRCARDADGGRALDKPRCTGGQYMTRRVDTYVLDAVGTYLADVGRLRVVYDRARQIRAERVGGAPGELERVTAELENVKRASRNVVGAISASGHSNILLAELEALEARSGALQSRLEHLRGELAIIPDLPDLSNDDLLRLGASMWERVKAGDIADQRAVLRAIVQRVTVGREAFGSHSYSYQIEFSGFTTF